MNPDMALSSNLSPWTLGDSIGHSDLYDLSCSMLPRLHQSNRLTPRLQAFAWTLVASWTTDFNTDPGYSWAIDLNMVLGKSPGLDVTVVPCGSQGHED